MTNDKLEIIIDKKIKFIKSKGVFLDIKGTYIMHKENDVESTLKIFYRYRIPEIYNNSLIENLHNEFSKNIKEHNHSIEIKKYFEKMFSERLSLEIIIPKDKYDIKIN